MMLDRFRNTWLITNLLFRRDRTKIIIWLLSLIIITCSSAMAYSSLYKTEQDIQAFALTMDNPAMIAMIGPGYELNDYSPATIFAHELLLFLSIAVAVMNLLFVGRSTRADEEEGQLELVRSFPVGRLAYLSASIIEILVVNFALFLLMGISLYALKLDGMNLESCLLFGAILGATGFIFASITAFFAQLSETSRGTISLSFGALMAAYILRAIGDVNIEILSYLSPLGWTVRTNVFANDIWWPVLIALSLSIIFVIVAYVLNSRRDLGAGLIPSRRGKEHASAFLKTSIGFVLNQQKINIIGWAVVLFALSASFGAIMGDLETYYADMEFFQIYFEKDTHLSIADQFLSLTIEILSLFSVVPAVMVMLRIYVEEQQQRMDHFYARAVPRSKMFITYFFTGLMATIIMQLLIALGLWSAGKTMMNDKMSFLEIFYACFAYLPSMWVMLALTTVLIGAFPKARNLIWGYIIICFLILYLNDLLNFPSWLNTLSSFEHASDLINDSISWLSNLLLLLVTLLLFVFGYIGYQRRDINF